MKPTTAQDYRDRVLRVITYIGGHLNEPLSLETLAGVAHFSPYHFHRIFRGLVGETLAEHIRRRRLEAAGVALRRGETVLSVTLDAGYESPEAFGRAFKALYGVAPSRFATAEPPPRSHVDGHNVVRGADGLLLIPPLKSRRTDMNIDVVTLNDIPVTFVRHTGPYDSVAHAFEKIIGWAVVNEHMRADTLTLGSRCRPTVSVPTPASRYPQGLRSTVTSNAGPSPAAHMPKPFSRVRRSMPCRPTSSSMANGYPAAVVKRPMLRAWRST